LPEIEIAVEFTHFLSYLLVYVHPFHTQLAQAATQTSIETYVIGHCCPKVLRF